MMSTVNTNNKAGHPVAGIVLGILGIAVALLMTLLFGVIAGAVAGASAAIIGATGATAEYGDQIDKASQKLGVSSTFYQEWEAVLQHSGTSMDSMSASFGIFANTARTTPGPDTPTLMTWSASPEP